MVGAEEAEIDFGHRLAELGSMHTIRVNFESLREVHLGNLFGACGVYVLWDSQAQARPTYIGEGNILKRLSDHWMRHDPALALARHAS